MTSSTRPKTLINKQGDGNPTLYWNMNHNKKNIWMALLIYFALFEFTGSEAEKQVDVAIFEAEKMQAWQQNTTREAYNFTTHCHRIWSNPACRASSSDGLPPVRLVTPVIYLLAMSSRSSDVSGDISHYWRSSCSLPPVVRDSALSW